jgi:23S rRNA pseudouridine2605 synthase
MRGASMALERLQKILARAGLGSRRECEEMIRQGRVTVNGVPAHLGMRADPERDDIRVDGRPVKIPPLMGFVLYKPRGVLSDPERSRRPPGGGRLELRSELG